MPSGPARVEKIFDKMLGATVLTTSNVKQSKLLPSRRVRAFKTPPVMLARSTPAKLLTVPVLPPVLTKKKYCQPRKLHAQFGFFFFFFVLPRERRICCDEVDQIQIDIDKTIVCWHSIPIVRNAFVTFGVCQVTAVSLDSEKALENVLGCKESASSSSWFLFSIDLHMSPSGVVEE